MGADPYRYFRVEAAELHAELGQGVLDLERGARAPDLVLRLLRAAHTLKGAARVVKQREIADHAHAFEEALVPLREPAAAVAPGQVDALLAILDAIGARVAALGVPTTEAVSAGRAAALPGETYRTTRANVAEMDALLDGIREAHIQLAAVRRSQGALERARRLIDTLVDQLPASRARDDLRGGGAVGAARTHSLVHEIERVFTTLERGLSSGVDRLDHELCQVREAAEHMRLVPAGALFTSLELAVRDVASAQGKSVVFDASGGDVRLDAQVLGAVQGALLQLVRNAVAHGIELPAERDALGKPRDGRVVVEVSRRGQRVAFLCRDDGRGVDREGVRRAAVRKGIVPVDGHDGQDELLELLLRGRLSTSASVTELSGRGIGLDLLRDAAEQLGGEVAVVTESGKGTSVELVVPQSLTSVQALIVDAGDATAAIPIDAVRETVRIPSRDVTRTERGQSVVHRGTAIPFVPLTRVLGMRAAPRTAAVWSGVVVEGARGLAALGVERLLGTAIVIQRPLPDLAPCTAVVAGASLDSAGAPRLVLDPDGLVDAALGMGLLPELNVPVRHRILVVDDSMTTRMLEQSILESAGYDVDVASSGEEGLAKARLTRFALYLVDVEMPGIDGFTFIEQTRADPMLRAVPAILVTSRDEPADRRRGEEVGARGYIVKGAFDQSELLERIRTLVTS